MNRSYEVILLAAGSARRFNHQSNRNKVLMPLKDRPVFDYSLRLFLTDPKCRHIWFVIRESERTQFEGSLQTAYSQTPSKITWVTGGKERQDSVSCALDQLSGEQPSIMLVHDAARPFISQELIDRLLEGLEEYPAVIPGIKAKDSMKVVRDSLVDHSLDRSLVRHIQTPQAFKTDCLLKAVDFAKSSQFYGNEEGELVERLGYDVKIVEGLEQNNKITTAMDYAFARFMAEQE